MRVARVEPEGDAPARLVERDVLPPDVHSPASPHWFSLQMLVGVPRGAP